MYINSLDESKKPRNDVVNRAAVILRAMPYEDLQRAVVLFGYSTSEWDAPDEDIVNNNFEQLVKLAESLEK